MNEYCPFDSQKKEFRSPAGAVPSGQPVEIFFKTPPGGLPAGGVTLVCHFEFEGSWFNRDMECTERSGNGGTYCARIDTKDYLGLIWYYFRLTREDGTHYYYGNNEKSLGGRGRYYDGHPKAYQITVYDGGYKAPEWYGRGVTYHIFPDRFARLEVPTVKGLAGDRAVHINWDDCPEYRPDKYGEIKNNDFFGGSIAGIMSKLEYLESLGVATIYLSPIFEAASNHRYDTADYTKIDPMLGTNEQFAELCAAAHKLGIHVMLDGVFNHTGSDSVYFNQKGTYPGLGAAQSEESPYYEWYRFERWPDKYSSWWGIYTLPQVDEDNDGYLDFIIRNPHSIVRRWLKAGADGWRLDVADELPDAFIERLRKAVKEEKRDAVLIGEVWEDASNKISYDMRRRHVLGSCLDGVMNYPFRDSVIGYLLGADAAGFRDAMENIRENYPKPAYYSLMNSIGTHDTPRILTVLGASPELYNMSKDEKAAYKMPESELLKAKARLRLGSLIMFCFPGSPTVYYGDEAGMEGFEDPFNRRAYPWGNEDHELIGWYKRLGAARRGLECLCSGDINYLEASEGILVFSRSADKSAAICMSNAGDSRKQIHIPWIFGDKNAYDFLTGKRYKPDCGELIIELPPISGALICPEM